MQVRIGPSNHNFKMSSKQVDQEIITTIRGRNARFNIKLGPLQFDGKTMEKTFLLEIDYENSFKAHARELPLGGFGARLHDDYGETANKIAEEFCKANSYKIVSHITSLLEYQAVVEQTQGRSDK